MQNIGIMITIMLNWFLGELTMFYNCLRLYDVEWDGRLSVEEKWEKIGDGVEGGIVGDGQKRPLLNCYPGTGLGEQKADQQ